MILNTEISIDEVNRIIKFIRRILNDENDFFEEFNLNKELSDELGEFDEKYKELCYLLVLIWFRYCRDLRVLLKQE